MQFNWTPQQDELYDEALSFARGALADDTLLERERAHQFSRALWERAAEFGFAGLCIDAAAGGMGLDALTTTRLMEALGRGCEDAGLMFAIGAHLFACAVPIGAHATPELRSRLLERLARGELIGANAITESAAGSDIQALACRARRDGDHYVLDGEKTWVTNAPIADVFVVYATIEPRWGYMGITAFVVERGADGFEVGAPIDKIGLTTAPTASIYLADCRVPAAHVLASEGQGGMVFESSMRWERVCLFGGYVGMMQRVLERTIAHATAREQGGVPIGSYQAVSHRIVDMKLRLESARLLLYRAAWLCDRGEVAPAEVALAKLAVSEAATQLGLDAIQVHGAIGVTRELGVERLLRDAVPSRLFSGTSEVQRNLIARTLGLGG